MNLKFGEDSVNIFFELDAENATDFTMVIYAKDKMGKGSKKNVFKSKKYTLLDGENHFWIVMDFVFYNNVAKILATNGKPLATKITFFFELEVTINCDNKSTIETEALDESLTLHFVRYIPELMSVLNFSNGEKLMNNWFENKKNETIEKVNPELNFVAWDWLINESEEFKEEYIAFKNDTIKELHATFNNDSKNILRSEINKMIKDGLITQPTKNNIKVNFGVSSNDFISYNNSLYPNKEIMPKFEKYYFKYKSFEGKFDVLKHYIREGAVDDFIAAIATCNFRVYATGYLAYKEGGYFSSDHTIIHITKLSFYIKDRYDFADDDPNNSQFLGYWKIIDKNNIKVSLTNITGKNYYEIKNKHFTDYRKVHDHGYDYHLYSTLKHHITDISLKL